MQVPSMGSRIKLLIWRSRSSRKKRLKYLECRASGGYRLWVMIFRVGFLGLFSVKPDKI